MVLMKKIIDWFIGRVRDDRSCLNCDFYDQSSGTCDSLDTPVGYVGESRIFYCNHWKQGYGVIAIDGRSK